MIYKFNENEASIRNDRCFLSVRRNFKGLSIRLENKRQSAIIQITWIVKLLIKSDYKERRIFTLEPNKLMTRKDQNMRKRWRLGSEGEFDRILMQDLEC